MPEEQELVEEYWSLPNNALSGFAQHERSTIRTDEEQTLDFDCAPCLTPVDMMNLSNGNHDATGHKVWMGAYVFIEAVLRVRPRPWDRNNDMLVLDKFHVSDEALFENKRVLELGCGTGVSGLALYFRESGNHPSCVTLTDFDPDTLDLCQRNYQVNFKQLSKRKRDVPAIAIESLTWGESESCQQEESLSMYDTVLATDVLYDMQALMPLLRTTSQSLKPGGFFVLSHVPRASLPGQASIGSTEMLEACITNGAKCHGLVYVSAVRPSDLAQMFNGKSLNSLSFSEMEDAGAAVLIYQQT